MIVIKNSKFYRELKILINCVRSYGIQHIDFKINSPYSINDEQKNVFIEKVHTGFYLAQDNVIRLLSKILMEQKNLKSNLKESRRNNNKELSQQIEDNLNTVKYQEYILRKIMDSLIWQFFQGDLSSLRRLYTGNTCIDITDSNLSSEIEYIKQHRKTTPLDFVLINDLTSFAQIGDIIIVGKDKSIKIVELKEGKVNEEIFNIINNYSENKCQQYLFENLNNKDNKFLKQLKRDIKQIEKAATATQIMTTGEGIDNTLDLPIKISQNEVQLNTFVDTVLSLLKESRKKGYAISTINNCLLIGVYDINKFPSSAFDYWVKSLGIKVPIFDLRQSIAIPLSYPLFLHPFSENDLIDILSGNVVIKMTIDINGFLHLLEENGFIVKWLNKKETARINSQIKGSNHIFSIDGCGIEIEKNGILQYLCDGLFVRMFTEFNTPHTIAKNVVELF